MTQSVILEFKGVGKNDYDQVNKILGTDYTTGEGNWPDGLLNHTGAVTADGGLVVYEIWESKAAQEAFMARLGPALHEAGLPEPVRVEWFDVIGHYHTHSH
jgi:hypothetical protein